MRPSNTSSGWSAAADRARDDLGNAIRTPLFVASYLSAIVAVAAVVIVNVLTLLHDAQSRGEILDWRRPLINEFSSGGVTILLFGLVLTMAVRVPIRRERWPLRLLVHLAASLVLAILHVSGMVVVRLAAFAAVGLKSRYAGFDEIFYEWRKDLLVYAFAVAGITLLGTALIARRPARQVADEESLFEIHEGRRVLRIPGAHIAAARSAGNYVEMVLLDGQRRLVRSTLARLEAGLAPHGLVRVHRSWLVNLKLVRQIQPTRGGDRRLTLDGGLTAPCSRRYIAALNRISV